MRIYDYDMEFSEVKNATAIMAKFGDFDGDAAKWRMAYFDLLAWKNTWCIPYKMDICSTYEHEAYLKMVIPEEYTEKVLEILDGLGYKNVSCTNTTLVQISNYDAEVDWVFED